MKVLVQIYEGRPIGIELPQQVTLEVTEADRRDERRHGGAVLQGRRRSRTA